MNSEKNHEEAVSSVVGEMVLLALVIILVALFSTSAFHLLPGDREDTVEVLMDHTNHSVSFYHKGGDWVEKNDLRVIVIGADRTKKEFRSKDFHLSPDTEAFDLGSNLTVMTSLKDRDIVRLATKRSVVFSGVIEDV